MRSVDLPSVPWRKISTLSFTENCDHITCGGYYIYASCGGRVSDHLFKKVVVYVGACIVNLPHVCQQRLTVSRVYTLKFCRFAPRTDMSVAFSIFGSHDLIRSMLFQYATMVCVFQPAVQLLENGQTKTHSQMNLTHLMRPLWAVYTI